MISAADGTGEVVWGAIPKKDLFRYQMLCGVSFLTMTGYWIIRAIKMGVFNAVVGLEVCAAVFGIG